MRHPGLTPSPRHTIHPEQVYITGADNSIFQDSFW